MTIQELKTAFDFIYNHYPAAIYCARLNVNEINCCIDIDKHQTLTAGVYLLLSANNENIINIRSLNEPVPISFTVKEIQKSKDDTWLKYPLDIFKSMFQQDIQLTTGFNIFIWGNIPDTSDIAAHELLQIITAYALDNQLGTKLYAELIENKIQTHTLLCQQWIEPEENEGDDED